MPGEKMDLSKQNNVLLVKVPKYLSLQWQKATGEGEVGKVRITRKGSRGEAELSFILNKELAVIEGLEDIPTSVPRKHTFVKQQSEGPSLAVFTENPAGGIALMGKVVQRAECKPVLTGDYLRMKNLQIKKSYDLIRLAQQINSPVPTYKPVASHSHHRESEKRKKQGGRRTRADKQQVMDMLFGAFERHQYYKIKDLVALIKQPVLCLKKILREIGMYNARGPHKHTWELRPEYRHYGGEKNA